MAEEIFLNLNPDDLDKCTLVNGRWENIINNPSFLVKKFIQLGIFKKFGSEWKKAVQSLNEGEDYGVLTEHLNVILKDAVFCHHKYCNGSYSDYSYSNFHYDIHPIHWAVTTRCPKIFELLATSTECSNLLDGKGRTPIHMAASRGYVDVIKVLIPLTENPNTPNDGGTTPIFEAAKNGHTEVIELLAPLTDNPNAPDSQGKTPIDVACEGYSAFTGIQEREKSRRREDIIRFLKSQQYNV